MLGDVVITSRNCLRCCVINSMNDIGVLCHRRAWNNFDASSIAIIPFLRWYNSCNKCHLSILSSVGKHKGKFEKILAPCFHSLYNNSAMSHDFPSPFNPSINVIIKLNWSAPKEIDNFHHDPSWKINRKKSSHKNYDYKQCIYWNYKIKHRHTLRHVCDSIQKSLWPYLRSW